MWQHSFIAFGAEYRVKDNIVNVVNYIRRETYTSSSEQLTNTLINKHAVPFYVNAGYGRWLKLKRQDA